MSAVKRQSAAGRKPFRPTEEQRKQVTHMVAMGLTQLQICSLIHGANGKPITKPTLEKHFRQELDSGMARANLQIATNVFKIAQTDSKQGVTAAIFWLKTRAGWSEKQTVELSGPDGGAIQTESKTTVTTLPDNLSEMDAQELAKLYFGGRG